MALRERGQNRREYDKNSCERETESNRLPPPQNIARCLTKRNYPFFQSKKSLRNFFFFNFFNSPNYFIKIDNLFKQLTSILSIFYAP